MANDIFSETNLAKHVATVFTDVPKDHQKALVGYAAFVDGKWVTKFSLVVRDKDGKWTGGVLAQFATGEGFDTGAFIKRSW